MPERAIFAYDPVTGVNDGYGFMTQEVLAALAALGEPAAAANAA